MRASWYYNKKRQNPRSVVTFHCDVAPRSVKRARTRSTARLSESVGSSICKTFRNYSTTPRDGRGSLLRTHRENRLSCSLRHNFDALCTTTFCAGGSSPPSSCASAALRSAFRKSVKISSTCSIPTLRRMSEPSMPSSCSFSTGTVTQSTMSHCSFYIHFQGVAVVRFAVAAFLQTSRMAPSHNS